jgi:hypothetical protein
VHCLSEPGTEGYRQRAVLQRHELASLPPPFAATIEAGGLF